MTIELTTAVIGIVISFISVAVATWSARKSNKYRKEQIELQRKVVDLEEQRERERKIKEDRALLRAEIDYLEHHKGYYKLANYMAIKNLGNMKAEYIRMYVNGEPVSTQRYMMRHHSHILNDMSPGGPNKWSLSIDEETPDTVDIELKWDDETGKDYSWKDRMPLKIK